MYRYVKATPDNPHPGRKIPLYLKTIPTIISALGLGILGSVAFPVLTYQLKDFTLFKADSGLLSPSYYQSQAEENQEPIVISGLDYTKASSWFPGSIQNEFFNTTNQNEDIQNLPDVYQLSIPSLGIVDANVALKDEDLTKALVHFPQTALPGQLGAPVIFGHSTIPTFYKQDQYKTIFSNLPKVKEGSDILISFNGKHYTYRIQKKYEVKPNELWVLRQNYSNKSIKVVTCVPPGTTLRRLVVEGTLVSN